MKTMVLLAAMLLPASALADFEIRDWKSVRTLQASAPTYVALVLDAAAFGAAQPSLADLRVVDNGNDEVPYRLSVERSQKGSVELSARMQDLSHSGRTTSFVLDLKAGAPRYPIIQHNAVTMMTKSHDFRADVKVEASDDGSAWQVLRDRAVIFEVNTDYKASHLSVSYPASTRRYIRLSVTPQTGPALDIQGATVCRETAAAAVESQWAPASIARREEGRTTVWDIDMGFDNVPVSRAAVVTDDRNFQRPIRITATDKGPDGVERRSTLWSGVLWRFVLPGVSNEGLSVEGADVRRRQFRVEIDNGDNPPLAVRSLQLFGPRHTLHFSANRPQPYRLYSGNPDAHAPVYDLAAFGGYMNFAQAPTLGFLDPAPRANPQFLLTDKRPWTEKHQKTFWAALILVCGFLIFMIAQKTREILLA